jgi:hypothetical protein
MGLPPLPPQPSSPHHFLRLSSSNTPNLFALETGRGSVCASDRDRRPSNTQLSLCASKPEAYRSYVNHPPLGFPFGSAEQEWGKNLEINCLLVN